MQRLLLIEMNRWWFIKHSRRGKFYKLKYWKEQVAREEIILLEEEWQRNPSREDRDVTNDFHVGFGKCEAAVIYS